ncbi:aldo/keto reductase [candidate division KSB1 bacterium]
MKKKNISRKEFLEKSCAGILAYGLTKNVPVQVAGEDKRNIAEYRTLGRTGIKVSSVGFGASRTMEPSLVKIALDSGINFLDTGRAYYNGRNEIMIGKVLKGIRNKAVIQSKMQIRFRGKSIKNVLPGEIKKTMQSSLETSLKALQTDYIDIMLIHGASDVELIENETVMNFFSAAKEKGIIGTCGFSSHANQIELLKTANKTKFYDVIMVPYNHKGSYIHMNSGHYSEWDQTALEIELKKAHKNNIGLIAMKTTSGGPYSPDKKSKPTYKDALKWLLNHEYIHTMAVAMGNLDEINENIQAMT